MGHGRMGRNLTYFISFMILVTVCSIGVRAAEFRGQISATVVTAREDGVSAKQGKFAAAKIVHAETQAVAAEFAIEDERTATGSVAFAVYLEPGVYDLLIEKSGYLTYSCSGIEVKSASDIALPPISLIAGDFNSDFTVDINDFIISLRAFDLSSAFDLLRGVADINEDGVTNAADLGIIKSAAHFGKSESEHSAFSYLPSYDRRSPVSYADAYYLIDDLSSETTRGLQSGWDYDNRNQFYNVNGMTTSVLDDISEETGISIKREITPQRDGNMILETQMTLSKAQNGMYLEFSDQSLPVFGMITQDGYFKIKRADEESYQSTGFAVSSGTSVYRFKIELDLDGKKSTVNINGADCGIFPITDQFEQITKLVIGTTDQDMLTVIPTRVCLYSNYLVNERFLSVAAGGFPYGWEKTGNMSVQGIQGSVGDSSSMRIDAAPGSKNSAKTKFAPISGTVCFETYLLLPVGMSGASVSLDSEGEQIIKVATHNNRFVTGGGQFLRDYTSNVWQCVRVEADTETQTALLRINGKETGTFPFEKDAAYFDGITVSFEPASGGVMWFDDVMVFALHDYEDYVPEPVPAEADGYYIGINVCSLWRNGHQAGWDQISAFEDLSPILGFYDEGIPEVADWENKWMVEHGIDYQHFCWYAPSSDINAPLKRTPHNSALHDGYFNSKYSHLLKFNFMWENNSKHVSSFNQFKQYLWSYWVDYYFTDDRFMSMDNQAVMTVWSYGQFISAFGGEEGAREAVEFMKRDIQNYGYDGLILLFADSHQMNRSFFEGIANIGADGTYGYHWNTTGSDANHQIYRMSTQAGFDAVHIVPTVSVGFNSIGWHGIRYDMISLDGHETVARYIKDTHLPQYEADSWKSKALLVSTWNEYGEGTYVAPAGVHGFGYLDTIRNVFTNAPPHADVYPTEAQKARTGYLYPQNRSVIRNLNYLNNQEVIPSLAVRKWDMSNYSQANQWKVLFRVSNFSISGGVLSGVTTNTDGAIGLKNDLGLNAADVDMIHVRVKASAAPNSCEIYFTTTDDRSWTAEKGFFKSVSVADEFVDVYFDVTQNPYWDGTIEGFRLDPMITAGYFEIAMVEFLAYAPEQYPPEIVINGYEMSFDFRPQTGNGEYLVTANPRLGFFSMLNLYHEWSRFTGRLSMANIDTEIEMQVGSNLALVNGEQVVMPAALTLHDGLPLLPLKFITECLGYDYQATPERFTITFYKQTTINDFINRVPNQWEFNIDGDGQGFAKQNCTYIVKNGALLGEATGDDPAICSEDLFFNAADYNKVKVRMRHDYSAHSSGNNAIQLFFKTSESASFSEGMSYKLTVVSATSNGNYIDYTFHLPDNAAWTGIITQIRLDPFQHTIGTFDIDYIRFVNE